MKSVFVRLSTIESIRDFVSTVLTFDYDIDLRSGRYLIDAKSIMGIFSLDLLSPIELIAHTDKPEALLEKLQKYIVE
ncbi:MAG: HPr family phosphocarrier protein [Clostridia bacterium]|nr:HPr family phosphocarrier protein [Clostridia bacterium]